MVEKLHCNVKPVFFTFGVKMTDDEKRAFGQWLQAQIKDADLKQKAVAVKAGISEIQIARIIAGTSGVKRDTVISIVEAFNQMSDTVKIHLAEALNRAGFAPTFNDVPDEIKILDFNGLSPNDLKDITDFIKFKRMQNNL